jgi:mannobiose 2-epimerase
MQNLIIFRQEIFNELLNDILPFWMEKMRDDDFGGFYGRMDGKNNVIKDSPKGGILNARILWTFSSVYLNIKDEKSLSFANRAKDYFYKYFFDDNYGGTYWMLDAKGNPVDSKKQIYSQAFSIYALVEYYRATSDKSALDKAVELFGLIEKFSFDENKNGYFEAFSQDWKLLDDLRLSDKDANEKKTMNTHLHILEAYTNLYGVYKNQKLAEKLDNLIYLFLDKIINKETHHLDLFFDEDWNCKSTVVSYGHDIEASWLLYEAAEVLGNKVLTTNVKHESLRIAKAALEGINSNGGLINEMDYLNGHVDKKSDWWPQAEAIVGFVNAWQLNGDKYYLQKAYDVWKYIKANIIDNDQGEWYWSVDEFRNKDFKNDKAGFWKCPYHNSRMCLEVIKRTDNLLKELH